MNPEDYVLIAWLNAEQAHKGPVPAKGNKRVEPHLNELASKKKDPDGE